MSCIAQECKEKRNSNANIVYFIKSEVQKLTGLEINKLTENFHFHLVSQEPNEESLPSMRLKMPCPGYGLRDG